MLPIDPEERLLEALRGRTRAGGEGASNGGADDEAARSGAAAIGFDLDHLERIGRAARALRDDPASAELMAPPAGLWSAISAELGFEASAEVDTPPPTHVTPPPTPTPAPTHVAAPVPVAPVIPLARPNGTAAQRARRGRGGVLVAAAAALVAVLGATAVVVANRDPGPDVVAEVALEALESGGSGEAKLVRLGDGRVRLDIEQQLAEVPQNSYVEVWLIDPSSDLQRMVSLGSVDRSGTFAIPNGIDPATYSIVDVSIEPADGDPTHSGRSVLRGTLDV